MPSTAPLSPSSSSPPLPGIGPQVALFLDFDGTLVDIAPQPEDVVVPPGLVDVLRQLSVQLNGALAIVSGRKLTELDAFLAPLQLPTAAEHGAQQRMPGGQTLRLASPDLREVTRLATALAESHDGLRVEIKPAGVALHYRHAPELEAICLQLMLEASRTTPGLELLRGKFVFEIKPVGVNKGTAIEAFMADAAFAGRHPLFAGDDVTDEAGFAVMQQLSGHGIKVGDGPTLAFYRCASPAALRGWLLASCGGPDEGPLPAQPVSDHPAELSDSLPSTHTP